jgi:hypothetical protein
MPDKLTERLDAHNVSVDEDLAHLHLCGHVHLQTGRVCCLPVCHTGSCEFRCSDDIPRSNGNRQ